MNKYDDEMTVERLTVSLESELAVAIREAAVADDLNVSAWLADAARRQLASRGLHDVVTEWEAEHGAFSDDELAIETLRRSTARRRARQSIGCVVR